MAVYLVTKTTKTVTSDDGIPESYEFEPIGVYSNMGAAKEHLKFVYGTYLDGVHKIYGANFVAKDCSRTAVWATIIGESDDPDDAYEYVVELRIHEMYVKD